MSAWAEDFGSTAVQSVTKLAETVSATNKRVNGESEKSIYNTAGLYSTALARSENNTTLAKTERRDALVTGALVTLEKDMEILDNIAGKRPQLGPLEFVLLSLSVAATTLSPLTLPYAITEVLAPSAAAFVASIGIGAEYVGRVAVADSKEIAATAIRAAAEAEGALAAAERAKAIVPLCVGVGATAASLSLLAPVIIELLQINNNLQLVTELYLLCPLLSILSAALASLALQETMSYSSKAISIGQRRFAKSGLVGRTWLSATEQIERSSKRSTDRWKSFSFAVLPAPIIAAVVPGTLPTKTIIATALAACQSAYFLAQAEATLARATDAVALKARSAAVCDTYANQGTRSAAILPFTSALASLCAAATAAIVELPMVHTALPIFQSLVIAVFPTCGGLLAAAASVSKARCEVDAAAANQAALTLALQYENTSEGDDDPVLRPWRGVFDLIVSTVGGFGGVFKTLYRRVRLWINKR